MSSGVPVRLSESLTVRARTAASVNERSLTEQVEHWARLGQVVEDAILAATVQRLKTQSHDPELTERLALATTPEGQAKAAKLIALRDPVLHGLDRKPRVTSKKR
jgi:ParD-like antitoxin of type II ParDE toxin-antitoxin system